MPESEKIFQEQLFQKMIQLNKFHTQDKVDLFNALRDKFGAEVLEIVERVECEKARAQLANISKQTTDRSILSLIRLLWEPLRMKGFEYTYEIQQDGIQMRCTKCPVFEMAKELKATDWLYHHTCNIDPYIALGFNPKIGLKRTKTLMEGDAYCDHFYYLK